jgi:hypothetical protein
MFIDFSIGLGSNVEILVHDGGQVWLTPVLVRHFLLVLLGVRALLLLLLYKFLFVANLERFFKVVKIDFFARISVNVTFYSLFYFCFGEGWAFFVLQVANESPLIVVIAALDFALFQLILWDIFCTVGTIHFALIKRLRIFVQNLFGFCRLFHRCCPFHCV